MFNDWRRVVVSAVLVWLGGCVTRPMVSPELGGRAGVGAGDQGPGGGADAGVVSSPAGTGGACSSFDPRTCRERAGCAWDAATGACHEAQLACEDVTPRSVPLRPDDPIEFVLGADRRLTFEGGDPCEAVDPRCAFDVATGRCRLVSPVARCPATAAEASALSVSCMHSAQKPLTCRYRQGRGVSFSCASKPVEAGGMMRAPSHADTPVYWQKRQDYDSKGCPTSALALKDRCSTARGLKCMGDYYFYACRGGWWRRVERVPPRP